MPSHALDQRLFEKTNSLTNEQGQISASAADGVELIDGWLRVIAGHTSTQLIEEKLKLLRDQLTSDQPNGDLINGLLLDLADNTALVAQGRNTQEQTESKLDTVAFSLRTLAGM